MIQTGSAEYSASGHYMGVMYIDMFLTEVTAKQPDPRVLLSHYEFDWLPEQLKEGRVSKTGVELWNL